MELPGTEVEKESEQLQPGRKERALDIRLTAQF